MPFIDGFIVGFAMIVFVGPVLFTILQISLEKGFIAGLMSAIGVFISDVVCVVICYHGASTFINDSTNDMWISILGTIILLSIGFTYIFKPNLNLKVVDKPSTLSLFTAFTKGFLVNFVNPFVFAVWIAVIGIAQKDYQDTDLWIYLLAATFAVLVTDTIKVVLAEKLRPLLNPKNLSKIYKIIGFILVAFGIRVFAHIFTV